jgi:EAL domain-containing protein (putative c-di-GMP-specific phosphodiesterase class I)
LSGTVPNEQDYFRLRSEWLRFKNHVYDANTELPTLPAVLDDVRRLMEERGAAALVYLDVGGDAAETVHGWQSYDEILRGFAKSLVALRGDVVGPRDIVCALSVRSDKFLAFLSGRGSLDAAAAAAMAERLRERLVETLPRHTPVSLPAPVSFSVGHAVIFRDPMLRAERSVHRALDEAMVMNLRQRTRDEDHRARGLDAIIKGQQLVTLYQPILDLRDLSVLGHEVFTHGPAGGPFEDPERLFALAERVGRLVDFETLSRRQALETVWQHLPRGKKLFLNTSARTLRDPEVTGPAFAREVEARGLRRGDVVLEVTERSTLAGGSADRQPLRRLKEAGFGIAIDDMGAGYSSLNALVEMEPDYLKFDVSLVRNIDRSLIKKSLLETLVDISAKIGAQVIAEGVEAESEFTTLRDLGVHLGQGRYLAPPAPLGSPPAATS